jgi:phosphoserine phosphatase
MDCVLTLVAGAAGPGLAADDIAALREALRAAHASLSPVDWLAEGIACDIGFEGLPAEVAESVARQALAESAVDLFVQPVDDRRKALLVADMDSTIVTAETLDELAAFAGLKEAIAAITARAMRGELDFEDALRERVGMLKGLDAAMLDETFGRIAYTPGAEALVRTMAAHGAHCLLVSGGFTVFTDRVAAHCGFHGAHANTLIIEDGKLAGTVGEPILGRDAKLRILVEAAGERRLPLRRTAAVGDGANDLPMLQAAGLGVAFHAKPLVREAVGLQVNHGDLTALLYAQGYRAAEFAAT